MNRQQWIRELAAEIRELEELIAKAEQSNSFEEKWVVYLLRSILKRRQQALRSASMSTVTMH